MTLSSCKREFYLRKNVFSIILFFLSFFTLQAQQCININAPNSAKSNEIINKDKLGDEVLNVRYFDYNPVLKNLTQKNITDTLFLDFFEDRQFKAIIKHVSLKEAGIILVKATMLNEDFAMCIMAISEDGISISVQLPMRNEAFFVVKKEGKQYLSQYDLSLLNSKELKGSEPIYSSDSFENSQKSDNTPVNSSNSLTTIDLLIVYTEEAAKWANTYSTNINHVINLAIASANEVMENSQTNVVFNVVHQYQTNYEEVNNDNDLRWLSISDEIRERRRSSKADIVVLLANISFTGGLAYLLTNSNGSENEAAFSLVRVQQAASVFTFVHEIGHNMGAHHNRDQQTQPGPNRSLGNYTSGWRGTISGRKRCTVMSYNEGSEYGEAENYTYIPYFSSPDITVNGVTIGNAATMDNARIIRQTKDAIADYSERLYNAFLSEISLSEGTLFPNFHPNTTNYTVIVPPFTSSIEVSATKQHRNATIYAGTGNTALENNETEIIIKVRAGDGVVETFYTLNVIRLSSTDVNDSVLIKLSLSEGTLTPGFLPTVTQYSATVPYQTNEITVAAVTANPDASVNGVVNLYTEKYPLMVGENTLDFTVISVSGTARQTYTIVINRLKNNDATLQEITISDGRLTPNFSPAITQYEVPLTSKHEIAVSSVASDTNATVNGNGSYTLTTGENKIFLTVTAQDGFTQKKYEINFICPPGEDATLTMITMSEGALSPIFSPEVLEYHTEVLSEIEKIEIIAIPNDANATVIGGGVHQLEYGNNIVSMMVLAENKIEQKFYEVTVFRHLSQDATLRSLTVLGYALNPDFNSSVYQYNVNLPENITLLNIITLTNHIDATVEGDGNRVLDAGENKFILKVTAQDKTTMQEYEITVNRSSLINESFEQSLLIYPNPASDKIMIKSDRNMSIIRLYDGQGRLLQQIEECGNEYEMNMEAWTTGVYFLFVDGKVSKLLLNK